MGWQFSVVPVLLCSVVQLHNCPSVVAVGKYYYRPCKSRCERGPFTLLCVFDPFCDNSQSIRCEVDLYGTFAVFRELYEMQYLGMLCHGHDDLVVIALNFVLLCFFIEFFLWADNFQCCETSPLSLSLFLSTALLQNQE